jgi:hypothetical protein
MMSKHSSSCRSKRGQLGKMAASYFPRSARRCRNFTDCCFHKSNISTIFFLKKELSCSLLIPAGTAFKIPLE